MAMSLPRVQLEGDWPTFQHFCLRFAWALDTEDLLCPKPPWKFEEQRGWNVDIGLGEENDKEVAITECVRELEQVSKEGSFWGLWSIGVSQGYWSSTWSRAGVFPTWNEFRYEGLSEASFGGIYSGGDVGRWVCRWWRIYSYNILYVSSVKKMLLFA